MKAYTDLTELPKDGIRIIEEGERLRIAFDYTKEPDKQSGTNNTATPSVDNNYSFWIVDVIGDRSYANIVSSIINEKYPQQDMDAIRLNYDLVKDEASGITDEKRTEYLNDYKDMQSWRAHAKEIATKVIELKQ